MYIHGTAILLRNVRRREILDEKVIAIGMKEGRCKGVGSRKSNR